MPAYVLMKAFENAPARYDAAMDLLTLGRISRLKHGIARDVARSNPPPRILELGCGAGSLAVLLAGVGAEVLAIDASPSMIELAALRVAEAGQTERVELRRMSVMEIDGLPAGSFDFVICTLLLSELSDAEIEFVLRQARRLLAPRGQLVVGDETVPHGMLRRVASATLRWPLQLVTYLVTQAQGLPAGGFWRTLLYFAMELPLMLLVFFCVPPTSRSLFDLEGRLVRAGFRPRHARRYLGGTLSLVRSAVG